MKAIPTLIKKLSTLMLLSLAISSKAHAQFALQCMQDCDKEHLQCAEQAVTLYQGCIKNAFAQAQENVKNKEANPYKNYFVVCLSSRIKRENACATEYNNCMKQCKKDNTDMGSFDPMPIQSVPKVGR